ncbi:MAG: glycosyltransferase [Lentisphaeria bacterium]|nr:glycosyltransferase [Lentisphaeria bacterium]
MPLSPGKTALLHYWMTNMRGGENVLAEIAGIFPEADIFTHAYAPQVMDGVFGSHKIMETFIGRLPGARRNCQKYLPLMPYALSRLDLSGYELIISSESGPAKGICKPAGAKHICYCHTPMRYLWDMYEEYYKSTGFAGKTAMRLFKNYLRKYDVRSAENVDVFIANSKFVAERIKRIYGREPEVVYPMVDYDYFSKGECKKEDYYLLAGQLISYKRPDLALKACEKLGRRLVVTGTGGMEKELRRIAGKNAIFTGRVSREELRKYYAGARALIFPGIEDFGIVPLEAQSAGTPVIALGIGGALETVVPGKTGIFFDHPETDSLAEAILEFEKFTINSENCRLNAQKFTPAIFRKEFVEKAGLSRMG